MKRIVSAFLIMVLLMAGCSSNSTDLSSQENNRNKIFNVSSSYFDNFTSEQIGNAYIVKGTVHKENDENAIIIHIQAEKNIELRISGTLEKSSGADTELVYAAPDGTETKIADNFSETFEMTLNATIGDGTVRFKGEPAVYNFEVEFELLDEVSYIHNNQ